MGTRFMNISHSQLLRLLFSSCCGVLNFSCHSQVTNIHPEKEKIALEAKISLPTVNGRLDHISFDAEHQLAFISAWGNNSVEVVDINAKQTIHSITGLDEPQGVLYIPSLKKLVVASGGSGDCIFFDAATYKQSAVVHLKKDADNIRYDETSHLLYVGHGSGAIAVIDADSAKHITDIHLDQHPEAFQLSTDHDRLYVNVPDADEIEIAQLSTHQVIDKWKNVNASWNFPMTLDEKSSHLFVGCRQQPKLIMINTSTGMDVSFPKCSRDADDLFFLNDLVFLSAGAGYVDVFRVTSKGLVVVNHIATVTGARTSLLLPTEKKFLLAVPKHGNNPAALWVYNLQQ
jgi:DNA-binding beta-propeller fold protein YncE